MTRVLTGSLALAVLLCLLAAMATAQTGDGTIIICKGATIPEGYTILAVATSIDCPKGAYLVKKSEVKTKVKTTASRLTETERKEAQEVLLLIDVMELRLKQAWNAANDFGATTEQDRTYTKGAMNAAENVAKRLDKLPDGKYSLYLMAAAIAYVDVGRIRLAASEDDGAKYQRRIMENYKLENTEPHLWAWTIWTVARDARNVAAKELGIPTRNFEEER